MLPDPVLKFSLPSLHDSLLLDCRVHHPTCLGAPSSCAAPWAKQAAVIAHPYAPLGGCYDDKIVELVAGVLLRAGFVVGTFNFRGAPGSPGKTSWTAKAERADCESFVGFMCYYVHHLDPIPSATDSSTPPFPPLLLIAGYSYGAMITNQLPPLDAVLEPFVSPAVDTPAAEIRTRAQYFADMQNTKLGSLRIATREDLERPTGAPSPLRPKTLQDVQIDGEKDEQNGKRSREASRSFSQEENTQRRKVVSMLMAGRTNKSSEVVHKAGKSLVEVEDVLMARRVAYLLVSPLQGVIIHLVTMSFPLFPGRKAYRPHGKGGHIPYVRGEKEEGKCRHDTLASAPMKPMAAEFKLISNPTLAIYGDRDVFASAKRLRDWATRLQSMQGSRFRAHEVSTAGHFWTEDGVAEVLQKAIDTFAKGV